MLNLATLAPTPSDDLEEAARHYRELVATDEGEQEPLLLTDLAELDLARRELHAGVERWALG